MNDPIEDLSSTLNGETGKLRWAELARHFARGVVVKVAQGLDLVAVATSFVKDDKAAIEAWLAAGQIARAATADAVDWNSRQPVFWAVVTAPWVLVQEIEIRLDA